MGKPLAIEPISRALRLVEALNQRPMNSIEQLHGDTGLPKPTLVRLLQALIAEGYVSQVSRSAGYRLTARVLALSSGYHSRALLVDVAQPLMDAFTQKHKWPLYLAVPGEQGLWVRYSTVALTPMAPDPTAGYSYRLSPLVAGVGKAYLAFCSQAERRRLLAPLLGKADPVDGQIRDKGEIERLLAEVKAQGYATTGDLLGDRGRGLAVPLYDGPRVIGALSMRHFRSAMSEAEVAGRFLGPLRDLSHQIGLALRQARNKQASAGQAPRVQEPSGEEQT